MAALAAAVFFTGLGSGSLRDWDEATYAQVAREMAEGGDWLTPRKDGVPWFEKPPLYFWISAAGMRLLGYGELAPRVGAAVAGVVLVLLVWRFGARYYGPVAGWVAVLVLVSTPHVVKLAKMGMLDVPLTAASTVGMLAWWRAGEDRRWLLAWGGALGLAAMLKGAAIVPVLLACGIHALVSGRGFDNRVADTGEQVTQDLPIVHIILDDKDVFAYAPSHGRSTRLGTVNQNVAPCPGHDRTPMWPPCISTICLGTAAK